VPRLPTCKRYRTISSGTTKTGCRVAGTRFELCARGFSRRFYLLRLTLLRSLNGERAIRLAEDAIGGFHNSSMAAGRACCYGMLRRLSLWLRCEGRTSLADISALWLCLQMFILAFQTAEFVDQFNAVC
jgi:hypothetical protein